MNGINTLGPEKRAQRVPENGPTPNPNANANANPNPNPNRRTLTLTLRFALLYLLDYLLGISLGRSFFIMNIHAAMNY